MQVEHQRKNRSHVEHKTSVFLVAREREDRE